MYTPALLERKQDKNKQDLIDEFDDLQFQVFRMKENMEKIAKRWHIIGIDQTKHDKWVIIYSSDDGNVCKIMAHDCESPFNGKWDFSIHARYGQDFSMHIDDIKGPENQGFGSICMKYLKAYSTEQNIHTITGNISRRDRDHLDRLVHFYKKHHFTVTLQHSEYEGELIWHA